MKLLFSLLLAIVLVQTVTAQKVVRDPNAQVRTLNASFHAVQITDAFDVVLTQGSEEALAVSANKDEYIQYITSAVENGVLKIGFKSDRRNWWPKDRKLKAYLSVRNINKLSVSGACDVEIEGTLRAERLDLDFSGASDMKGAFNVNGLMKVDLSGASDLDISGSASELTIDASGASDIKGYGFHTRKCTVDASGATSVQITVNGDLSVDLSGASTISYRGEASVTKVKTSGASNLRKS